MVFNDRKIREKAAQGMMCDYDESNIEAVCYDLRANVYCTADRKSVDTYELGPAQSVFVQCMESIFLPENVIARVHLRNSRIREGLTLDAPVYYPGHETVVFFRVTNVSNDVITLKKGDGIASIMFEEMEEAPEQTYQGTFQKEMNFQGMAGYTDLFKDEIREVDEKRNDIKNIEKHIYANVITVMTVFIGLFSLINVNVSLAAADAVNTVKLLIFNLSTVGSVLVMTAVLRVFFSEKKSGWSILLLCGLAVAAFACAVVLVG